MQVIKRSALQYFASTNWKCLLSAEALIPIYFCGKKHEPNPGQQHACMYIKISFNTAKMFCIDWDNVDENRGSDVQAVVWVKEEQSIIGINKNGTKHTLCDGQVTCLTSGYVKMCPLKYLIHLCFVITYVLPTFTVIRKSNCYTFNHH